MKVFTIKVHVNVNVNVMMKINTVDTIIILKIWLNIDNTWCYISQQLNTMCYYHLMCIVLDEDLIYLITTIWHKI